MTSRCKPLIAALSIALALAGCATRPIVDWKGDAATPLGSSMPEALGYLDLARSGYRKAVADQMASSSALTNGLVGAGALVAALAAGKAHRDAILGTALVGGTAYGIGNLSYTRQRLLVYQAGVEALNCAQRASIPFHIDASDLRQLTEELDALDRARRALAAAVADGQAALDQAKAAGVTSGPGFEALDAALGVAALARQSADASLKAGREYQANAGRAARELVAAVDRIDAAVARAMIDATPDLSVVPKVISGLAGMVGSFAPGAGLEDLITKGLSDVAARGRAADGSAKSAIEKAQGDALLDAASKLASATAEAASLSASVNARLAGRLTAWPDDAFKDCGLAQVVSALGVAPAALDFVVGVDARRVFDISGGVKPYFVEIDGVVVDGVALKSPIRFDARGELSVSSKVAKPAAFKLRISDSSPTALIVELPVSIKAAGESNGKATNGRKAVAPPGPAASSAGGQPSAGAAGSGIDAAVAALKAKGSFKHGGKLFQLPSGPRKKDAKTIELALLCPAGDSATFKRADLERSLLAEIGITQAPPKRPWQIEFTPSGANCLAD